MNWKKLLSVLALLVIVGLTIYFKEPTNTTIEVDGWYTSKEEVSLYIDTYGELPDNFITKDEAKALGWDSKEGNLWDVAEGMSIGGDTFGNREGLLPKEKGRVYYECDIDYEGGFRNSKRIVFSNDGLIYYTEDHYESFEEIVYE
ncbi:MAG: ribonuclease [Erysipelotrichaceae bacterium]|nr:ribonuclease [Erysipelotrichaceae bacterium]